MKQGLVYIPHSIKKVTQIEVLLKELAHQGCQVVVAEETSLLQVRADLTSLDFVVVIQHDFSETTSFKELNIATLQQNYETNLRATVQVIDTLFPLLEVGEGKRICYISAEDVTTSNQLKTDSYYSDIIYSSTALFFANLFNEFRGDGFTFRFLSGSKGWDGLATEVISRRSDESHDLRHSDEQRFVQRNRYLNEIPW